MCDKKNHPLVEIYRASEGYDVDHVVQWCPDCGAVVVDAECDNRVYPGRIIKMRFPKETIVAAVK
jgi:valyl-tRNA synthetase